MTVKLVWVGKEIMVVAAIQVSAAIARHRKIMAQIERQGEDTCGGEAGVLGEKRLERLMAKERTEREALAAMPLADLDDMVAKARYLAELLETESGVLETDDLIAAFKSFAALCQPPK